MQAGPAEPTAYGVTGISPQRLESWSRITGNPLTPWEAETVLEMSQAYAVAVSDDKAPMPWGDGLDQAKAAQSIKAALRMGRV